MRVLLCRFPLLHLFSHSLMLMTRLRSLTRARARARAHESFHDVPPIPERFGQVVTGRRQISSTRCAVYQRRLTSQDAYER